MTTDSSGNATLHAAFDATIAAGQYVTATATDPDGNTSNFSEVLVSGVVDADIEVAGEGVNIADGAETPGEGDNTDFGEVLRIDGSGAVEPATPSRTRSRSPTPGNRP